jgi:hypothetical protein
MGNQESRRPVKNIQALTPGLGSCQESMEGSPTARPVRWEARHRLLWPALGTGLVLEALVILQTLGGGNVSLFLWAGVISTFALACLALDWRQATRPPLLLTDACYALSAFLWLIGLAGLGAGRIVVTLLSLPLAAGTFWLSERPLNGEEGRSPLFKTRQEKVDLLSLILAGFLCYTWGLRSWRYAMVGDEYGFFDYARQILLGKAQAHLLSWRGVYDIHPVLSSYVHVASMWLLGADTYGWRVSSIILVLWSALPLFALLEGIMSRQAALLGVAFYIASHYLMSFSKIGYNNTQALLPFLLALALGTFSARMESPLGAYLAGAVAGLGFYTFAAARLIVGPLLLAFLLFSPSAALTLRCASGTGRVQAPRQLRQTWIVGLAALGGLAAVALPVLAVPAAWQEEWVQTMWGAQSPTTANGILNLLSRNFLYAARSFLYSDHASHFVAGAHLDPLSAVFMLLGLGVTLFGRSAFRIKAFVATSYLFMLLTIGAMHQYDYPPNTRMFMLVPFYALFAGLGCHWCLSLVGHIFKWAALRPENGHKVPDYIYIPILFLIFTLNIYQSTVVSQREIQQPSTAVLLGIAQATPAHRRLYFAAEPGYNKEIPAMMFPAYGIAADRLDIMTAPEMETFIGKAQEEEPHDLLLIAYDLPERGALSQAIRARWPMLQEAVITDDASFRQLVCFADAPACAMLKTGG